MTEAKTKELRCITEEVEDYNLYKIGLVSAFDFIDTLDKMVSKVPKEFAQDSFFSYDEVNSELILKYRRPETVEEYETRVSTNRNKRYIKEESEKALLRDLIKKYGVPK